MQEAASRWRAEGLRLGFVPTMGALHAGHLSLLAEARRGCDRVVVSIFVNPLQFGPQEDLQRYPRDLDGDLAKLRAAGCDCVFAPETNDMYAPDSSTTVQVEALESGLCGASRPGHFRGVATVVTKLFHLVQPHVAVFGQKDAQQAVLLRRLVRDLDFDVEIRIAPIVRDADGLALSSRNAYLGAEERRQALLLPAALQAALELARAGEREREPLLQRTRQVLGQGALLRLEYVDLVDAATLQPLPRLQGRALLALAVFAGATRLLDNLVLQVTDGTVREAGLDEVAPVAAAKECAVIVLAAGLGKRMHSDLPKVLHPALGKPLLAYVLEAVAGAGVGRVVVVVGHLAERVQQAFAARDLVWALQMPQLGTGHAVLQAEPHFRGYRGDVLVLCGDTPLLTAATLQGLVRAHRDSGAAATVLTAEVDDPHGYGRIRRGPEGDVQGIVEEKDASPAERAVREINSGLYIFAAPELFEALHKVGADNSQREYYLTDTLAILRGAGKRIGAYRCRDPRQVLGVNDPAQLREAERILAQRTEDA